MSTATLLGKFVPHVGKVVGKVQRDDRGRSLQRSAAGFVVDVASGCFLVYNVTDRWIYVIRKLESVLSR